MCILVMDENWEKKIEHKIDGFPEKERNAILAIWYDWLDSSPTDPYYQSWEEFAAERDDPIALYSETRVYVKRVRNELRDMEIPQSNRQRIARALAAVASIFVIFFVAISRLLGRSE